MSETSVSITLVPGGLAPRYSNWPDIAAELVDVIITEQGTQSNLPIIDLVFAHKKTGDRYVACITGRIAIMIAAAVKGVNVRNHGKEEP